MSVLQDLVKFSFKLGLRHGEILFEHGDDIVISMRTLIRKNESSALQVVAFLKDQLEGSMDTSYTVSAASLLGIIIWPTKMNHIR